MTLSQYSMSSYESRKEILHDREAPAVDYALLEIKQAVSLLEASSRILKSFNDEEAEKYKDTRERLEQVVELLDSIDGDAVVAVKKMLDGAGDIANDDTRAGQEKARDFSKSIQTLDEKLISAYQVILDKAASEYQQIDIAQIVKGAPDRDPQEFTYLAGNHIENAQAILSKIAQDKSASKQAGLG